MTSALISTFVTCCIIVIAVCLVLRLAIWLSLLSLRLKLRRYGKLTWWDIIKAF